MADEAVEWVQRRLSASHPRPDICDLHARVDRFGLGEGVYPKPSAPVPLAHPFCRCMLSPRLDLTERQGKEREGAERAFLRTDENAQRIIGSRDNLARVLSGKDPMTVACENTEPAYRPRSVAETAGLWSEPKSPGFHAAAWSGNTTAMPVSAAVYRTSWLGSERCDIVAAESAVKRHPRYAKAKSGDVGAASALVIEFMGSAWLTTVGNSIAAQASILVGVHAMEGLSTNKIGSLMSQWAGYRIGLRVDGSVVQANRAGHTGASGWKRLASPPVFAGDVVPGERYWLFDDFIGQGGTLANLRGYIEAGGGRVVGATALTGRPDSATLGLSKSTLTALRHKHGSLEHWWEAEFGYGFDRLTESEARYLLRAEDARTIRDRLAAAR